MSPLSPDPAGLPRPSARHTDVGLLALAVIWGVNFSVIKVALTELHPFVFNALRFPLASLVLYALLRLRGPIPLPRSGDVARLVVLGLLGNLVYQLFFIIGLDLTTAGNASLLLATTPIWTLGLSVASGHERASPLVWVGILGTILGMLLVVRGGASVGGEGGPDLRGDLLTVVAAASWAIYTVGARRLVHRYGSLAVTGWTLWVGTAGLVLWALPWVRLDDLTAVSWLGWASVGYAGMFGISFAYALWYRGVQRLGNAHTAAYQNLVPIVALLVAWLWLGEVPGPLQMVGALVVLAGLTLARLAPVVQRGEPSDTDEAPESSNRLARGDSSGG